jgi:response regulator NasT
LSAAAADPALKVLAIDTNPIRRAILDAGLREAGLQNAVLMGETAGLLAQVYRIDPRRHPDRPRQPRSP